MSELQLTLTPGEPSMELELDAELVDTISLAAPWASVSPSPPPLPTALEDRNLFAEAQRIAVRAASASTRRQYAAIFRAFGDWLTGELARPPVVGDLDTDVIAAYGRYLTTRGRARRPRGGPATVRVYLSIARGVGRDAHVQAVRVPRHEPGPPETLIDGDYANLLRVPDPPHHCRQARLRAVAGARRLRATLGRTPRAARATCAARAPTPATTASTCAARAAASARCPSPRWCSRRSRRG